MGKTSERERPTRCADCGGDSALSTGEIPDPPGPPDICQHYKLLGEREPSLETMRRAFAFGFEWAAAEVTDDESEDEWEARLEKALTLVTVTRTLRLLLRVPGGEREPVWWDDYFRVWVQQGDGPPDGYVLRAEASERGGDGA